MKYSRLRCLYLWSHHWVSRLPRLYPTHTQMRLEVGLFFVIIEGLLYYNFSFLDGIIRLPGDYINFLPHRITLWKKIEALSPQPIPPKAILHQPRKRWKSSMKTHPRYTKDGTLLLGYGSSDHLKEPRRRRKSATKRGPRHMVLCLGFVPTSCHLEPSIINWSSLNYLITIMFFSDIKPPCMRPNNHKSRWFVPNLRHHYNLPTPHPTARFPGIWTSGTISTLDLHPISKSSHRKFLVQHRD